MADADKTLKLLIELGVVGKEDAQAVTKLLDEQKAAAADMAKQMDVVTVSQEDVARATKKSGETTDEHTKKIEGSRREIRMLGNELGRAAGLGNLGGIALGGIAAAAFAAGRAVEFLKSTWETIQETIKGPIEIGLRPDAPAHISAAAAAWNHYAEARAKVIASSRGAEGQASAEEKHLAGELKLLKEVLAAEKEKALADLELRKGEMSPEAYAAAKKNIGNIFDEAATQAEANEKQQLVANKIREAANLEIEAANKTRQALNIKAASANVAEANQKSLDEKAAAGEAAKKQLQERIALIERYQKYHAGGSVAEYEGFDGGIAMLGEAAMFNKRYGYDDPNNPQGAEEALKLEKHRLAQAQAQIDVADSYRRRQSANSSARNKLMDEAGTDSGKASNLRDEAKTETSFNKQQNATDAQVAALHQASASKIAATSGQTAAAVERFTAVTVAGFQDVHGVFLNHQRQIDQIRQQLAHARNTYH